MSLLQACLNIPEVI